MTQDLRGKPWTDPVPEQICQLPQLGLSCFGCCGYDWAPIDQIKRQISFNTWRYFKMFTSKEVFAETTIGVTAVGVCKGVIEFDDGTIGCPLHPAKNDGKDYRSGDCLRNFECNALKHYKKWPESTRRALLTHIAAQPFDNYTYSMANSSNSLIQGFMGTEAYKTTRHE